MIVEPLLQMRAARAVEKIMADVTGTVSALIATADGFQVASNISDTAQVAKISAMASSIAAIGSVVGEESKTGAHKSITIEADIERAGRVALLNSQTPIPSTQLFSGDAIDRRRGLVATFYKGGDFSVPPILQKKKIFSF